MTQVQCSHFMLNTIAASVRVPSMLASTQLQGCAHTGRWGLAQTTSR